MDFALSREQEMLQQMVRRFAQEELAPRAAALDDAGELPSALVKRMGELGLVGLFIPRELGGAGLGYLARTIAMEEISRVFPSLGFFYEGDDAGIYMLYAFGSPEMKQKCLPPLCRAEKLACFGLTEASGGSSPADMQTSAEAVPDGYLISGRKMFITLGEAADYVCIVARTGDRHTAFMVEKGTPGYEPGRRERVVGVRSIPVNELVFTGCRVPAANRLGNEGTGLATALATISAIARPGVAAIALGAARGSFDIAVRFAKERRLSGNAIINLQAIQFSLANMETEIEAAKWLCYYTGWLLDQGKAPRDVSRDSSRAKLFSTEVAKRTAMAAVQILGGYGTTYDYGAVRRLQDVLILLPSAGTQEVQRMTLGREIAR